VVTVAGSIGSLNVGRDHAADRHTRRVIVREGGAHRRCRRVRPRRYREGVGGDLLLAVIGVTWIGGPVGTEGGGSPHLRQVVPVPVPGGREGVGTGGVRGRSRQNDRTGEFLHVTQPAGSSAGIVHQCTGIIVKIGANPARPVSPGKRHGNSLSGRICRFIRCCGEIEIVLCGA